MFGINWRSKNKSYREQSLEISLSIISKKARNIRDKVYEIEAYNPTTKGRPSHQRYLIVSQKDLDYIWDQAQRILEE